MNDKGRYRGARAAKNTNKKWTDQREQTFKEKAQPKTNQGFLLDTKMDVISNLVNTADNVT